MQNICFILFVILLEFNVPLNTPGIINAPCACECIQLLFQLKYFQYFLKQFRIYIISELPNWKWNKTTLTLINNHNFSGLLHIWDTKNIQELLTFREHMVSPSFYLWCVLVTHLFNFLCCFILCFVCFLILCVFVLVWSMVFNATFNNISAISWRSSFCVFCPVTDLPICLTGWNLGLQNLWGL